MATLIGLCIRVKLLRSLPQRFKVCVADIAREVLLNSAFATICHFTGDHCMTFTSVSFEPCLTDSTNLPAPVPQVNEAGVNESAQIY